jgi:hypothetical protein
MVPTEAERPLPLMAINNSYIITSVTRGKVNFPIRRCLGIIIEVTI